MTARGGRPDPPFLVWKVRIFSVGAGLGLGGIFLDQALLIWAAIGVLGIGVLLRFLPYGAGSEKPDSEKPDSGREDSEGKDSEGEDSPGPS
jgi:hypothetical protein